MVGLNVSTAEDTGSILAWGTKILYAMWLGQKTEINFIYLFIFPKGLIVKHLLAHHCLLGSLTSDFSPDHNARKACRFYASALACLCKHCITSNE